MAAYPDWIYFPNSEKPPPWVKSFVSVVAGEQVNIDSSKVRGVSSNAVLTHLRPGLEALGYLVEGGKARSQKIRRPQIMALYELLMQISENPVVALNHAVAVAMVRGPRRALTLLGELEADERISGDHRLHAVRAHLLEMAGDRAAARASYETAARQTTSLPKQRYLHARAARLTDAP